MFYLANSEYPQNPQELKDSLKGALSRVFTLPSGDIIRTEGDYPQLSRMHIDLSGARVKPESRIPAPKAAESSDKSLEAETFSLKGQPILVEGARLNLELQAQNVHFDFERNAKGEALLMIKDAQDGTVRANISKADLETMLLEGAKTAAAAQKVTIEKTDLELRQHGERSLSVIVRVTVKKLIARATVVIEGKLEVDDSMNARLSGLACRGEGMLGSVVCGFVTPHLQKFDNFEMPLMAVSLGDIKLRDLQLQVKDGLRVEAAFGSQA